MPWECVREGGRAVGLGVREGHVGHVVRWPSTIPPTPPPRAPSLDTCRGGYSKGTEQAQQDCTLHTYTHTRAHLRVEHERSPRNTLDSQPVSTAVQPAQPPPPPPQPSDPPVEGGLPWQRRQAWVAAAAGSCLC